MNLLVPEPAPVDDTKAAVLYVAPEMLGLLLSLPEGQKVAAASVDWATGAVMLKVVGEGMPDAPEDGRVHTRVDLVCTRETRPGEPEGQYEYRLTAAWSHAPGASWVLRPWGPVA